MFKKFYTSLFVMLLIIGLTLAAACSSAATSSTSIHVTTTMTPAITPAAIPTITTQDADTLIKNNKNNNDFVILDVRTPDEFNSGHIAGAVNIDYYAADFKAQIAKLDKAKQYLIYCRTGVRAAASVQIMLDSGFKQTQNMAGGITKWLADGYPTVQ
jgi:rhodanese-related sulfurtransferase